MPSKFLTLLALMAVATMGVAQPYWSDDFEAYTPGPLCFQDPSTTPGAACTNYTTPPFSGGWTGWFDNVTEVGIVVGGGNGRNGSANYFDCTDNDPVQPFSVNATTGAGAASGAPYHPAWGGTGTYPSSGAWRLSAWFRVPTGGLGTGMTGYFIVNNEFGNIGTAPTNWSIQISMADNLATPGTDYFLTETLYTGATLNGLAYDTWYEMECNICLDANACIINVKDGAGALVGGAPLYTGAYEVNAGNTAIENLDLYSAGLAVVHYDDITLDVGPCGPFEYQYNRPGESELILDGLNSINPFTGGAASWGFGTGLGSGGSSNHLLNIDAAGAPADILITPLSAVTGRSATTGTSALINSIFGDNTLNVEFDAPAGFFLYGGTVIAPNPTPAIPFAFNAGLIPGGTTGAQMATISATNSDGWALSGAVEIETVGTIGFLDGASTLDFESFEAGTGWDQATQTFGPNWTTPALSPSAAPLGTWTVWSGGTTSGGTGPAGAYDGTQYVYCEVSGAASANDFVLEMIAPISGPGATAAHYKLHLDGTATGNFILEEYDPGMAAWVAIGANAGPLGTNWTVQSAPLLFPGAGSTQLRLRYNGATGFSGDCCIDQLTVGF